jgi:predicted aconitase
MRLTRDEQEWMNGDGGPALQWAIRFNAELGAFFDADKMLPVASAHFAPDTRMAGDEGLALLKKLVSDGARSAVPATLDPCTIDFGRAAEMIAHYGLTEGLFASDQETMRLCRAMGFRPTYSCINYQSVSPPRFGAHLAWGDTGAAISANSLFGARTNFEGGPAALASAITGRTPAYGLHLPQNRHGNVLFDLQCDPREIADWGAVAILTSRLAMGYDIVPVFRGDFASPSFNMLKQLGVALASYGGHAMFHVVGATPEAATFEAACGRAEPREKYVITVSDLSSVFEASQLPDPSVDLVVFAAPQLSVEEVQDVANRIGDRKVHENVKLIMAIDPQVRAQTDAMGLTDRVAAMGAEFSTGTCFYGEAPLMHDATGWRNIVTNSAKLVNTLASAGYSTALRRIDACLDAAVSGQLQT